MWAVVSWFSAGGAYGRCRQPSPRRRRRIAGRNKKNVKFCIGCSLSGCGCVIIEVKTNDPFEAFLQRYRGMLFTLVRRYSHRSVDVDDLLQDASLALWRDSARLLSMGVGPQQAALTWKIARNAMIDTTRRHAALEALPEGYDGEADDSTLVDELHAQVDMLDEPDRTLVNMQLEGYSYDEIAAATSLTVKNVSVRLVRAKEKLRKYFI